MIAKLILSLSLLTQIQTTALATSKLPTRPLEERVSEAKLVFVGKLINKQVNGEWAQAEILVEQNISGVKVREKIKVTWRISINGNLIYDAAEGTRGIAILKDKHKDRYWLRADKFENLKLKEQAVKARSEAEKVQKEVQPETP